MKSYLEQSQDLKQKHSVWISNKIEPMVENHPTWMIPGHEDSKAEYRKNNYSLRCDDFVSGQPEEIIFAGCERTIPMDIKEEDGWAYKIFKDFGAETFANLSYPGASVHKIVPNLYKYFKSIGNPKNICLLAPEMIRDLGFWQEHEIYKPKIFYQYRPQVNEGKEHNIASVPNNLPMQLLAIRYLHTMRAFEQYCDQVGINLVWTSWCGETNKFLNEHDFKFFVNSKDDLYSQQIIYDFFSNNLIKKENK